MSSSEEEFVMEDSPQPEKKKKKVKVEDDDDDVPLKTLAAAAKQTVAIKKERAKKTKKRKVTDEATPPKKKKIKTEAATSPAAAKTKHRQLKQLDKTERLQYAMQSFLWWDAVEPPAGCQWRSMEHAGVSFPEPYIPHGIPIKYDGQDVQLTPAEEEAATFFAAMDPEGMHLGDPKTAKIFIKNYFEDFRAVLGKSHIIKVNAYKLCLLFQCVHKSLIQTYPTTNTGL